MFFLLCALVAVSIALLLVVLWKMAALISVQKQLDTEKNSQFLLSFRQELSQEIRVLADMMTRSDKMLLDTLNRDSKSFVENFERFRRESFSVLKEMGERLEAYFQKNGAQGREDAKALLTEIGHFGEKNERRMEALQQGVEQRLEKMRQSNEGKLEQMRQTVDEKLQGTLEKRLGAAFSTVNENLDRVSLNIGEMRKIAENVGDLKKVLGNIKTRGIWGEGQLGAMLEDVLSPEQFAKNVEICPGSRERVEFAIRLPGASEGSSDPVWLPIDAKLPVEDYERLVNALEAGDVEAEKEARRALERRVYECAKEIRDKYVHPPFSTDMGIMFLPTEGLFAEVVRRTGLIDRLQSEYRVMVAGPTTLMTLLSALRMGFKSLAVHQRSGEISKLLGGVKTEFNKFGIMLSKVEKKLQEAQNVLNRDGKTRFRVMKRALRSAEEISEEEAQIMLGLSTEESETAFEETETPQKLHLGETE